MWVQIDTAPLDAGLGNNLKHNKRHHFDSNPFNFNFLSRQQILILKFKQNSLLY